jgi:lipopolysaccharide heptosyltransferase II
LGGDQAVIDELQRREFDAAVLFSVYSQNIWASALLCRLAGIPLRLGHSRENPYDLLTDWVPELEPESFVRHEVQRQVELVERIGAHADDLRLSLTVSEKADDLGGGRLRAAGVDLSRPWVLVHPGSRAASRRYPPEMFAQAARTLVLEDGWQVCFSGSCEERPLVEEIRSQMDARSYSLAGPMELEELAAIISHAPLLITNNTGPAHIAAALGTSQVTLYAQTNPQHMPWHTVARVLKRDVACRYCYRSACPEGHHDCLRLIQPDEVVRAARELMAV